jgi:hypothetical protein
MNHFSLRASMLVFLVAAACSRSKPEGEEIRWHSALERRFEDVLAGEPAPATASPAPPAVAPSAQRIQPFLTSGGLSFVVPKRGWWVNFNAVCLRDIERANPGGVTALQMFEAKLPELFTKLRAQGVELHDDLQAMGGYRCGQEICIYAAVRLPHPDRFANVLDGIPGSFGKTKIDAAHYAVTVPLPAGGDRKLHVRWVPLDWSAVPSASTTSLADAQRAATHLVLLYGVNAGQAEPDPFAGLASPIEAAAKVSAVERLAEPASDRCLVGETGDLDERGLSDMRLRGARFVVAAPPRQDHDVAARTLGYQRSVDIEVALTVEGKPSQADATRWVAAGKQWVSESLGPAMGMLAGSLGDQVRDARALLEAAITYRV